MRTANPVLNDNTFRYAQGDTRYGYMTINGTVNRTYFLLFLLLIPAIYTWDMFARDSPLVSIFMIIGIVGGLIAALITVFKKTLAAVTAPVYAVFEGLFLGGISAFFESMYPGIVIQAVTLTFGVLFCLLLAYKSGYIKVTENFKLGVVAATGSIFVIYLISFVMGIFGVSVPYIHESGVIGIGFSLFVVTIAALNLVLDFDFIENGARNRMPKYMEWYAAFGLMVTLVWLYLEILRLLAKMRDRR
ncbi:MAG: Bax inhibitor-1/YccA family protein [Methanosarcinaceae archaeon]|nr:Bax inhibitor-1/YccA family protein [Methanosarcinaceae archaeon]